MRTGRASFTHGLDESLFFNEKRPIHCTGRNPPNIVGSRSPTARSSIFLSPLTVLIVVPFRKQLVAFPFAQPFPTSLPFFPQFAEAGSVFDRLPSAANARIAPIFMVLRRGRWGPRFFLTFIMFRPLTLEDAGLPFPSRINRCGTHRCYLVVLPLVP